MPVFDFYLKDEIALLRGFLRDKVGLREATEVDTRPLPEPARAAAKQLFDSTCSVCHGHDGRGSATGLAFAPPVPDLTRLSVSAAYGFEVVTQGYPGTMMRSFADEPEDVRRAAVALVQAFYSGGRVAAPQPPPDGGV
jgi:mono/diheme cytochrome c family protein